MDRIVVVYWNGEEGGAVLRLGVASSNPSKLVPPKWAMTFRFIVIHTFLDILDKEVEGGYSIYKSSLRVVIGQELSNEIAKKFISCYDDERQIRLLSSKWVRFPLNTIVIPHWGRLKDLNYELELK